MPGKYTESADSKEVLWHHGVVHGKLSFDHSGMSREIVREALVQRLQRGPSDGLLLCGFGCWGGGHLWFPE
jgi:hypothetical protein